MKDGAIKGIAMHYTVAAVESYEDTTIMDLKEKIALYKRLREKLVLGKVCTTSVHPLAITALGIDIIMEKLGL